MPLISRTLLAQRLHQLEDADEIESAPGSAGQGDNLDPVLLMWAMHRRVGVSRLTAPRVVMRFELRGVPSRCWLRTCWLEASGMDVCTKDPGFEIDMTVHADLGVLARVWAGAEGRKAIVQALGLTAAEPLRSCSAAGSRRLSGVTRAAR